jgi:hypothetical protein
MSHRKAQPNPSTFSVIHSFEGNPMKTLIATIVLTAGTAAASAAEYTNFDIPAGTLSRAEVRAAIAGTPDDAAIQFGEATQFALPAAGSLPRIALPTVAATPVSLGEATEFPLVSRAVVGYATLASARY